MIGKEEPLVSVVIPAYNCEETIKRSIESVLLQSYKNTEIIVVDDGSEDGTRDIVSSYGKRVRLLNQEHKGANAARNFGIREANGEIIAFLDSDDEWLPEKLELQLKHMEDDNFSICFCAYTYAENEKEIFPLDFNNTFRFETNVNDELKKGPVFGTPTLVATKNVLESIALFDESLPRLQDYELSIRLAKKNKIGYVPRVLVVAHKSCNSITNNREAFGEALSSILKKHSDFVDRSSFLNMAINYYKLHSAFRSNEGWKEIIMQLVNWFDMGGTDFYEYILGQILSENVKEIDNWTKANNYALEAFFSRNKGQAFAIYGAGTIAKKAINHFKENSICVDKIIVTNPSDSGQEFEGLPICSADQLEKDYPIIIAANKKNKLEMMENLNRLGRFNYCSYI